MTFLAIYAAIAALTYWNTRHWGQKYPSLWFYVSGWPTVACSIVWPIPLGLALYAIVKAIVFGIDDDGGDDA